VAQRARKQDQSEEEVAAKTEALPKDERTRGERMHHECRQPQSIENLWRMRGERRRRRHRYEDKRGSEIDNEVSMRSVMVMLCFERDDGGAEDAARRWCGCKASESTKRVSETRREKLEEAARKTRKKSRASVTARQ
jgi:hypothetical protein